MFVELTRPLADHRPGDLIEVDPAAARTLADKGYTRPANESAKSLPDFLRAVRAHDTARLAAVYGSHEAKTALGTETGAHGGFLIPDDFLPEILFPLQDTLFRSRALIAPMSSGTLDIPCSLTSRNSTTTAKRQRLP